MTEGKRNYPACIAHQSSNISRWSREKTVIKKRKTTSFQRCDILFIPGFIIDASAWRAGCTFNRLQFLPQVFCIKYVLMDQKLFLPERVDDSPGPLPPPEPSIQENQ